MELPASITAIISFAVALLGAYVALFLIGLAVWTFRDIRARTRDVLMQILAVLLVLVFNVPGLVIYFIFSPQNTLSEAYERALGQEALLQDIEERYICPGCKRRAEADFLVCPNCQTPLRKRCRRCDRLISLNWETCPYCGHLELAEEARDEGIPPLESAQEEDTLVETDLPELSAGSPEPEH